MAARAELIRRVRAAEAVDKADVRPDQVQRRTTALDVILGE